MAAEMGSPFDNRKQYEMIAFHAETETPLPPGTADNPLVGDRYVIEYCYRGKGIYRQNEGSYPIQAGQCFATFPNTYIRSQADLADPWAKSWVCLCGTKVSVYLMQLGITLENPVFSWQNRPEVLDFINQSIPLVSDHSKSPLASLFTQSAVAHHLFALLAEACSEACAQKSPAHPHEKYVEQAIGYIHQTDGLVTVTQIAAHIGIGRNYLSTLFHRLVGKTIQEYLVEHRMKFACTLFANPMSTVSNVADTLGYDSSAFSRIFKQVTGMTPIEYKASLRGSPTSAIRP